jgi:hypothetical protein
MLVAGVELQDQKASDEKLQIINVRDTNKILDYRNKWYGHVGKPKK